MCVRSVSRKSRDLDALGDEGGDCGDGGGGGEGVSVILSVSESEGGCE